MRPCPLGECGARSGYALRPTLYPHSFNAKRGFGRSLFILIAFLTSYVTGGQAADSHLVLRYLVARGGVLYGSASDGAIIAIRVDSHRVVWQHREESFDAATLPAIGNGQLYAWLANKTTGRAELVALDLATGERLWAHPLGPPYGRNFPVVCSNSVVVTDLANHITLSFQKDTGASLWDTKNLPYILLPPPMIDNRELWYPASNQDNMGTTGIAILECDSGKLSKFVLTGTPVGRWLNPSRAIFLVGGRLLVGSEREHTRTALLSLDVATMKHVWRVELPALVGLGVQSVVVNQHLIGATLGSYLSM